MNIPKPKADLVVPDIEGTDKTDTVAPVAGPTKVPTIWIFDGTNTAVRRALGDIMRSVQEAGTDIDLVHTAEMVIAEALNNVVEHAYADRDDGWIKIEVSGTPNSVLVRIFDEGNEMPNGTLPSGDAQDLDVGLDDLPEGGFGWNMIRMLTQDLRYTRIDGQNRLSFSLETELA